MDVLIHSIGEKLHTVVPKAHDEYMMEQFVNINAPQVKIGKVKTLYC